MDLSEKFVEFIETDENFKIAYGIIRENSKGEIWLIGGGLSRNLNRIVHGAKEDSFDFYFVVEEAVDEFDLPEGWKIEKNGFGNPKFVGPNGMRIDYVPIKTADHIVEQGLEPRIENLLAGTPFTIQAIAYDIGERKIIGEVGLKVLYEKKFEVNNLERAKKLAKRKNMSLNEVIIKKARSMGFEPVLIEK